MFCTTQDLFQKIATNLTKREFTNPLSFTSRRRSLEGLNYLQQISEITTVIKDGQWHPIEEINSKTTLPKRITREILQFLADYNFIILNVKSKEVRITSSLKEFLKEDLTS